MSAPAFISAAHKARHDDTVGLAPFGPFHFHLDEIAGVQFRDSSGSGKFGATDIERKRYEGVKLMLAQLDGHHAFDLGLVDRHVLEQELVSALPRNRAFFDPAARVAVADRPYAGRTSVLGSIATLEMADEVEALVTNPQLIITPHQNRPRVKMVNGRGIALAFGAN